MDYDVIIIGAGSMGMAAGYYLSKQGRKVLLLDANDPPHSYGSHHGSTRIIRHAYGEGDSYVEMALRAQQLWLELQGLSDEKIFLKTGVLNVGSPKSAFIQNVIQSAKKYSLPVEVLSAGEVNQRWKGFNLPDEYVGLFEGNSGVLMSEKCVAAYRKVTVEMGGTLKVNTLVKSVKINTGAVEVRTSTNKYKAKSLIITTGAGTSELSKLLDIQLPLTEVRKTFSWFDSDEDKHSYFPAFAFQTEKGVFYGFPSIEQEGVKIGRHDGGQVRDMQKPIQSFGSYTEDEADVASFAKEYIPNLGNHKRGEACTYTMTPDEDFIIDNHSQYENVLIASGFSGHGFKFSSVVGEILAQMITEGKTEIDISKFRLNRFN